MMKKWMLFLLTIWLVTQPIPVALGQTDDSVTKCANGYELFLNGDHNAAYSLLEAGFSEYYQRNFTNPDILGKCALSLGILRYENGDRIGSLEPFLVAVDSFRGTGNQELLLEALNWLGSSYSRQGLYDDAFIVFQDIMSISRQIEDIRSEANALYQVGVIYNVQNNYFEALEAFLSALEIWQKVGNKPIEGEILLELGSTYFRLGYYKEALESYEESRLIWNKLRARPIEGTLLSNIATVLINQGFYGEAVSYFQRAFYIAQEENDKRGEANALNGLGVSFAYQGRFTQAINSSTEALAIFSELGLERGEVSSLNNLGNFNRMLGNYSEGLQKHFDALSIQMETEYSFGLERTLHSIGLIYSELGNYDEAINYFEDALKIQREIGDLAGQGLTLRDLGIVFTELNQYQKALDNFNNALDIQKQIGDFSSQATTLAQLGFLYEKFEQNNQALFYYSEALLISDIIRANAGSDGARSSYIGQHIELYNRALDLNLQNNYFSEAFFISEQGRSRSFLDSISTNFIQLSENDLLLLLIAEQDTYANRIETQNSLSEALAINPANPELVTELEIQFDNAVAAHNEALANIAARSEKLTSLVPGRRTLSSLSEIQMLLDEQSTLVSYWVLEDRTIAFILTENSVDVISIDIAENTLNTQVKAFHDFNEIDSAHPNTATTLFNTIIAPIRPYLNTPHLLIVPHQALHYVPFAALTDGERYLMDDFNITYLPSASMLQFLPSSNHLPVYETALILGNPAAGSTDDYLSTDLPNAEQAAQTIASIFGTTPLVGLAATEMAVRDNVSMANILHLGAHGRFNTVSPMQSALYLTPGDDETDVGNDGRLNVDEVYGLPLDNIELVVLSACETNLGYLDRDNPLTNISAGDELVSLNRAFLFQSPTVISTLWTVDDAATGLLMEQFYKYLLDGKSKADALRLAQLDVRNFGNGEYSNPYYWAGFILSGDGGEINDALLSPSSTPEVTTEVTETEEAETAVVATTTPLPEEETPEKTTGVGICLGATLLLGLTLFLSRKKWSNSVGRR